MAVNESVLKKRIRENRWIAAKNIIFTQNQLIQHLRKSILHRFFSVAFGNPTTEDMVFKINDYTAELEVLNSLLENISPPKSGTGESE